MDEASNASTKSLRLEGRKRELAVVTMVYNEPVFLPIWMRYYSAQAGLENVFVIDHGSSPPVKLPAGCGGLINISRSPQDENQRVRAVSQLVSYLLNYYQWVIYCDADEILVPNPKVFSGLRHLCRDAEVPTITSIGLNLHHMPAIEPPFDPALGVLTQRRWARFVSPMCKPLITKTEIVWGRGFHSSNQSLSFGDVFLFHLRYIDLDIGLERLAQTRALPRQSLADEQAAAHQRLGDGDWADMMNRIAGFKKVEVDKLEMTAFPVAYCLAQAQDELRGIRQDFVSNELWRVPDIFMKTF